MEPFYDFIEKNAKADVNALRLKFHAKGELDKYAFSLLQIKARQKTAKKLPAFLGNQKFLFPSLLCAEQSTHQAVAAYHAELIGEGQRILDMTAGLGIDSFAISLRNNKIVSIELDEVRYKVLEHNATLFQTRDESVVCGDSISWLQQAVKSEDFKRFDAIFIDPARRDSFGNRIYYFADCLPNVVSNHDLLAKGAAKIFIKSSPILDINQAIKELPDISEFHIVSVRGECKEVLCVIKPCNQEEKKITVVDLEPDLTLDLVKGFISSPKIISRFEITYDGLGNTKAPIANLQEIKPGNYLYDPNAGMHKLHAANELCRRFPGLKRLDTNSDLYCSESLYETFPGRKFRISSIPDKTNLKRMKGERREVISRNHPLTPDQLRKNST